MSFQQKALTTLKSVPQPVWTTLGVAAIGGVVYWAGLKPIISDWLGDDGNEDFDEGKDEVKKVTTNDASAEMSITDNEAKGIAQQQLGAMDRPGTNDASLFDQLANLNGQDLKAIYNHFGVVWYDPLLGTQSGSFFKHIGHKQRDLFGWYREELGSDDLRRMQEIWYKSGLSFGRDPDSE